MIKNMPKKLATVAGLFVSTLFMVSCSKSSVMDEAKPSKMTTSLQPLTEATTEVVSTTSTSTGTAAYSPSAIWKTRPDGLYSLALATLDYKNPVNGWADTRMSISGGKLKTTLTKNVVGPDGGLVSWIDVADASEYQMSYDFMFDNNFDLSQGGKIGWGFLIGDGFTGGVPGTGGTGASVRLMWYKAWSGAPVIIRPYVYYKDQPGQYGDDFGKTYPSNGSSISKGVWHKVSMYVKCNTGSNTNGKLKITIDGVTLLDMPIRYTTNDAKRLINRITFETFRGGADATWTSPTDGNIYFDNLTWTPLAY
jgi:outer membrane lipoprotein-sorting protein